MKCTYFIETVIKITEKSFSANHFFSYDKGLSWQREDFIGADRNRQNNSAVRRIPNLSALEATPN